MTSISHDTVPKRSTPTRIGGNGAPRTGMAAAAKVAPSNMRRAIRIGFPPEARAIIPAPLGGLSMGHIQMGSDTQMGAKVRTLPGRPQTHRPAPRDCRHADWSRSVIATDTPRWWVRTCHTYNIWYRSHSRPRQKTEYAA